MIKGCKFMVIVYMFNVVWKIISSNSVNGSLIGVFGYWCFNYVKINKVRISRLRVLVK